MKLNIAVIGLGYVGLPLALSLGKYFKTVGYDMSEKRILDLKNNIDSNNEFSKEQIKKSKVNFSYKEKVLEDANFFIITVPTPIYKNKIPNLEFIKKASDTISKFLKHKSIVVYESTVYPGLTEEFALPILQKKNNLLCPSTDKDEKIFNKAKKNFFYLGYSPERINPGDKRRKLSNISKIISSNVETSLKIMQKVYKKIIRTKIYKIKNIKVAESAKIIENTQRDLNIALFNELSIIFDKLNIDSKQVFDAAQTKWNFHRYYPGLVGGHCIGVDPYYLTYLSKIKKYVPKIILAGRVVNDNMHNFVFNKINKIFLRKKINMKKSNVLILGYTFKENCSDIRNSRVIELAKKFSKHCKSLSLFDPIANKEINKNKKIKFLKLVKNKYDLIIVAVSHNEFKKTKYKFFRNFLKKNSVFVDLNRLYDGQVKSDFSL